MSDLRSILYLFTGLILDLTPLPSCLEGAPQGKKLEELLIEARKKAEKELNNRFPNPIMTCERYKEKEPHPNLQEAFRIKAKLPWHDNHRVPVKVEVTRNEM